MIVTVLTLFPGFVEAYASDSILARARAAGVMEVRAVNIRDFAPGRHAVVDDAPYGGGGGMLMKAEPVAAALDAVAGAPGTSGRAHVIAPTPRGRRWDQQRAVELAEARGHLVIVCGRYEGIDQRVIDSRVDEEVSLGDFVLTGGELPALTIIDSIARLLPGALGNESSAPNDSFSMGLLEGPHYTRPEEFEGVRVPEELLSGNHAAIARWRLEQACAVTRERRPDLFETWQALHPPPAPKRRRRRTAS